MLRRTFRNYSAERYNVEPAMVTQVNSDNASLSMVSMNPPAVKPPRQENTSSVTAPDTTPSDTASRKPPHICSFQQSLAPKREYQHSQISFRCLVHSPALVQALQKKPNTKNKNTTTHKNIKHT